ncbi:MAG: DUF350 domain-containing protein [Polyangiaceae bacterium]|nr:DUF350 domain-containing protein [Polyangiaceae bacterium]
MDLLTLRALSLSTVSAVVIGLALMILALTFLGKVLPFSIKSAIGEKRNDAVSIILFSVLLGLAIILSSTFQSEAAEGPSAAASASAMASVTPASPVRSAPARAPIPSAAPRKR